MAKPQTKFNMIWRNLDRAFSMPVFSKHETTLLQVARELSYTASVLDGSRRAKPFRLNLSRLAERRGVTRENLSRGLSALLTDNVFVGTRDKLRINKRYRQWGGSHKLTDRQIRECDDALDAPVTTCGETLEDDVFPSTDEEPTCDDNVTVGCDEIVTPVTKSSHPGSGDGVTKSSQKCDEIVTVGVTKSSQSHIGTGAEDREREQSDVVAPSPAPANKQQRPFRPDRDDVKRVQDWALTVCEETEEIHTKVRQFSTSYPLDWIEAAILCGVVGSQPGAVWRYAHKCLLSWWSKGQPDHAEVTAARAAYPERLPAPAAPRPTAREERRRRSDAAMHEAAKDLPAM